MTGDTTYCGDIAAIDRYIVSALEYAEGTHSLDDVRRMILAGDAQLWLGARSAIVTEVASYPSGLKTVHYWLVGGAMSEVLDMQDRIDGWAKSIGCTRATACGRRGWERVLAQRGWRAAGVSYAREL